MNRKIKRLLGILLCLCMLLSLVPQIVFAEGECENHSFDENYFCSLCGKNYVASVNGTFYETFDEAWVATNELTDHGRYDADAQLVLHRDATILYDYDRGIGTLWEGATLTIEEGVTLTADYLRIRDEMINHGTIIGLEEESNAVISLGLNYFGSCGSLGGDGDYYIRISINVGVINSGTFHSTVDGGAIEIYGGTFLDTVTSTYTDTIIYGGMFEDIVLKAGVIDYDTAALTINGVVYDYFSTGNTITLIDGAPHTHLPGEVTYECVDKESHKVLTACLTCPYECYVVETEEHVYANGYCVCGQSVSYDIYVGGVEVTADNYTDILSDGTASYDPETYTLTLNNADIKDAFISEANAAVGIMVNGFNPLNIILLGDNFVSSADHTEFSIGCYVLDTLSIEGIGTLTIEAGEAPLSLSIITAELLIGEETTVYANGVSATQSLQNNGELHTILADPDTMREYEVYGNATLASSLTVNGTDNSEDSYAAFTIPEETTLTIRDGVTLTIADATDLYEGKQNLITNSSKIILEGTGIIVNKGLGTCTETATHCLGADFKCLVCGYKPEAVPDETLRFSMSITAGAEMRVNYNVLASILEGYQDFYLEVQKATAGGETVITTYGFGGDHIELGNMENYFYYATYTGIAAKEMGDNFSTTLYARDAEGNVYCSNTVTCSIMDFLLDRFNEEKATDEAKTMAIDMLKYGAAAQIRFGYGTDALVTDGLSEEQLSYATAGVPEATDSYAASGNGADIAMNVTVGPRVELGLSVNLEGISDLSVIRCEIRDLEGNLLAEPEVKSSAETIFHASYSEVGAREMRKPINVTFYSGAAAVSKTITWNVETYVARERSAEGVTQAQIDVVNAMLVYGDSVGAYLISIDQ